MTVQEEGDEEWERKVERERDMDRRERGGEGMETKGVKDRGERERKGARGKGREG